MNLKKCVLTIFVILLAGTFLTIKVKSQTVTFSAAVIDASMEFMGYSSPNSFITFKENGSVIGTTTADAIGYYYKNFPSATVGIHSVTLSSKDTSGNDSLEFTYEIVVLPTQITSIVFDFPPTLEIIKSSFQNEDIQVKGFAKPNTSVTIKIDGSGIQEFQTVSNNLGEITYIILKQNLPNGSFVLSAYLTDSIEKNLSRPITFTYNAVVLPPLQETSVVTPITEVQEQISGLVQEYFWTPLGTILGGGNILGETTTNTTVNTYIANTFLFVLLYLIFITLFGMYILYKSYATKR